MNNEQRIKSLEAALNDLAQQLAHQQAITVGLQAIVTGLHATHHNPPAAPQAILQEFAAAAASWEDSPRGADMAAFLKQMADSFAAQWLEEQNPQGDTSGALPN